MVSNIYIELFKLIFENIDIKIKHQINSQIKYLITVINNYHLI